MRLDKYLIQAIVKELGQDCCQEESAIPKKIDVNVKQIGKSVQITTFASRTVSFQMNIYALNVVNLISG